jgi:hypothetical protein
MPFKVIDSHGRTLPLDDGEPVPPGCRLVVSAMLMDSVQRSVAEDEDDDDEEQLSDAEAAEQRCQEAYRAFKDRLGATMNRRRVPTEFPDGIADEDRPAAAYDAMKRRLGRRWQQAKARRPKKSPVAWGQEWQR